MANKKDATPKNPSGDVNIDYPLTQPAVKAYNDRLDHDAKGSWARPEPVDAHLLRDGLDGKTNVASQQPEEFEASGGQGLMDDNSDIKPDPVKEDKAKK